jgi:ureidoglycolate dehydrogenase (NAD+)
MSESSPDSEPRVDHGDLKRFSRDVLEAAGVAPEHAELLADALVRADLRGVHTHGLARLETYVRKFEAGGFNPTPDIAVEAVSDSAVLVDADDGPGQSAAVRAMDEAMARADESGVGIGAVTNSNHFGTAAYYTERASEAGYIGVSMTNVGSDVVPYGGVEAFLGTNPISVSIPTDRSFPVTLDMATSVVAMGKVDHAADEGESLPDHWAVDADGDPATTPEEVAALRPLGGPKGYGLAIVVDVLCGLLTGVGTSPTVGPLYDAFEEPMRLGHFVAAIDVEPFREGAAFAAAVGEYIDRLRRQETREGVDAIRVPGEPEAMRMATNRREGVPLNDDGVEGIRRLAERYGLTVPAPL